MLRNRGWWLTSGVILAGAALSPFVDPPAPLTPALTALPLEFLAGLLLARWYFAQCRLARPLAWGVIGIGLAVIVYAGSINAVGGIYYNPVRIGWYGIPAAMIVAGLLSLNHEFRFPPPLLRLGDISYSLYLSHPFVIEAMRRVAGSFALPSVVMVAVFIGSAVIVAALSYSLIEVPSTRYLSRALGVRDPRPAARPA